MPFANLLIKRHHDRHQPITPQPTSPNRPKPQTQRHHTAKIRPHRQAWRQAYPKGGVYQRQWAKSQ
ncbi:hypothetical protein [Moraxella lacunata]|uniref:hypothetical protein n=1 Tax=Moraxella lacunata TaxID=477 RepID=UPI003EE2A882